MKQLKFFLATCILLLSVSACTKDDNNDLTGSNNNNGNSNNNTSTYNLTVWSDFSGAPISVYINSDYEGSITQYYSSNPGCNSSGCVNVTFVSTGKYSYSASDGTHKWSGTGTISGSCNTLNLTL